MVIVALCASDKAFMLIKSHRPTPFRSHVQCLSSGGFGCCWETRSNSHTSAPGHPDLHLYKTEHLYHSSLLFWVPPQRSPANKRLSISFVPAVEQQWEKSCLICFVSVATLYPTVKPEFHNSCEVSGCVREMGLFSSRWHNCCFYTSFTPILTVLRQSDLKEEAEGKTRAD